MGVGQLRVALALGISCGFMTSTARAERSVEQQLAAANDAARRGDSQLAVKLATAVIEEQQDAWPAFYLRGRERFRLGDVLGSAADFDRVVALNPARRASLWERGISCYYAGRYQDGAEQFTAYQTFDDNDVENAVWHFLCLAQHTGVPKARRAIIRIQPDLRIPMMTVYDLYRGSASVQDVLDAAETASPAERDTSRFYAHLYIGLYYDALQDEARSKKHIRLAANRYRITHYMGDVAQIHARRWSTHTAP